MSQTSVNPIMIDGETVEEIERYAVQLAIQLQTDMDGRQPTQLWINRNGARLTLGDGDVIDLPALKTRQDEPTSLATAKVLHRLGFGGPDFDGLAKVIRYHRYDLRLDATHPMAC